MVFRVPLALSFCFVAVAKLAATFSGGSADLMLGTTGTLVVATVELTLGVLLCASGWRVLLRLALALTVALVVGSATMMWTGITPARCGCFGGVLLSKEQHFSIAFAMFALAVASMSANGRQHIGGGVTRRNESGADTSLENGL